MTERPQCSWHDRPDLARQIGVQRRRRSLRVRFRATPSPRRRRRPNRSAGFLEPAIPLVGEIVDFLLEPLDRGLHLLLAVLRLMAALVDQVRRQDDQEEDLEEFRVPVLERPLPEVDDVAVPAPERGLLPLARLVGGVLPPAEDRVEDEAGEEEDADGDAEAVVTPESFETRVAWL